MSKMLKRTVGVILLACMLVSSIVTPVFSAEMVDITELDLSDAALKKIYFKVETDKDLATYEINEEMVFTVTLWADMDEDSNKDNDVQLSAPYYAYSIKGDDGKSESGYADASTGVATIKTSLSCAGAVRLVIDPANAEKKVISDTKITRFVGGAMAAASEIQVTTSEPEDFDEFWRTQVAELDAVAPELLYIKEVTAPSGFKEYEVRIACVDDTCATVTGNTYVAASISIPDNAAAGSMGIEIIYNGYGVSKSGVSNNAGYISMNVNAHSIPLDREDSYYTELAGGVLKNYGWSKTENADPKTSYFRNVILRDLQGLRFLEKYFGTEGVASTVDGVDTSAWAGLWDGERILLRGSSQGGFQSIAVAALASEVTEVRADVPWFADIAGRTDANKIPSTFLPTYVEGLRYYDTALLAKRVKAPLVTITAGTGDTLCPMVGVQAIYNNLKNDSANITFRQGKGHSGTNTYPIDSVQMRSESVITGKIDSEYTKIKWEFNIDSKVLTIVPTATSGWNEVGSIYLAGSWSYIANQVEEVVVVGKLYKISSNAFLNHKNLRKVTLSESVSEIASKAFMGCSSLYEVCVEGDISIPGAADLTCFNKTDRGNLAFGSEIFSGASSIKALILGSVYSDETPFVESNLPDNLETIYGPHDSEYLKKYCADNGLKFVPFGKASPSTAAWTYDEAKKTVTVIGSGAIESISETDAAFLASAEKLVLGAEITELGSDVFAGLTGLKSVSILGNAPKVSIGSKPFGEKDDTFAVNVSSKATGFNGSTWCGYNLNKLIAVAGDINNDGEINAIDSVLLAQYLADWDVAISKGSADTNGDGSVNAVDSVILAQYLAGWDVELSDRPYDDVGYGDNEFDPNDIW